MDPRQLQRVPGQPQPAEMLLTHPSHTEGRANGVKPTSIEPNPKTLNVHPSPFIKSAILNRFVNSLKSDPDLGGADEGKRLPELRLAALEFHDYQQVLESRLECAEAAAVEVHKAKRHQEDVLLLELICQGKECTSLDPVIGTQVAEAARDTLVAEEGVILSRIALREEQIRTLQAELEEVRARIADANMQVQFVRKSRDGSSTAQPQASSNKSS